MNSYDETLQGYLPPDDQSEGLGAFPPGPYLFVVTEVESKQTQKGGYMWRLSLEVADGGPYQGRKQWYNMNWLDEHGQLSGGIGFTQAALKALGLPHQSNNGQPMTMNVRRSDIVGKYVVGIVSIQQGGQYAGRNQVDRLESANALANTGPTPAPWVTQQAPAPTGPTGPAPWSSPPAQAEGQIAPSAPPQWGDTNPNSGWNNSAPASAPAPAPAWGAPAPTAAPPAGWQPPVQRTSDF